jgi:hypothetical protein
MTRMVVSLLLLILMFANPLTAIKIQATAAAIAPLCCGEVDVRFHHSVRITDVTDVAWALEPVSWWSSSDTNLCLVFPFAQENTFCCVFSGNFASLDRHIAGVPCPIEARAWTRGEVGRPLFSLGWFVDEATSSCVRPCLSELDCSGGDDPTPIGPW